MQAHLKELFFGSYGFLFNELHYLNSNLTMYGMSILTLLKHKHLYEPLIELV